MGRVVVRGCWCWMMMEDGCMGAFGWMGLHGSYGVCVCVCGAKEIFLWSVEENVVSELVEMVKKEY